MRIGIDFDNTIAGYDPVWRCVAVDMGLLPTGFDGGKSEVRAAIRSRPDGETDWQRLQGQVYGKYMPEALLLDGVDGFLQRCRRTGEHVFVVSHKTEYGHFDPERISLREAALAWMEARGFFATDGFGLERGDVYFEGTRAEKLERIATLGLDHFIDDLPEVLDDPDFPDGPARHLFAGNWDSITREVFGDAA